MCGANQIEAESLRRLDGAQCVSIEGGQSSSLGIDLLDRVGWCEGRNGRSMLARRLDRSSQEGCARRGSRAVMDKYYGGRGRAQSLKTCPDGGLAGFATEH